MFRKEKNRGELQDLGEDYFTNVVEYLKQKQEILNKSSDSNLFAEEEKARTEKQLFNIKKLLRDLYERREKKIFEMALSKSRNPRILIDETTLLSEEKVLYHNIIAQLTDGRENILHNLLKMELPMIETAITEDSVKLRFVKDTPEFVNSDMEMVGPFKIGQTESFSKEIADILLEQGNVQVIQ